MIEFNDSIKDLTAKDLLTSLKQFMSQENSEPPSTIFVPDVENEEMIILPIGEIPKEYIATAIKMAVEKANASRYFGTYVAYVTKSDEIRNKLLSDFKKLKQGEMTGKKVHNFLNKLVSATAVPSQNALAKEYLLATVFDKKSGSDALCCEIKKRKGKYSFGEIEDLNKGHSYNRFNIWFPEQYDLTADGVNKRVEIDKQDKN